MNNIRRYEPLWGEWHVESLIGEGSVSQVYKVKKEGFGKTYYSAVKIISIPQHDNDVRIVRSEGMDDNSIKDYYYAFVRDIIQEIEILYEFRGNSNIVSFEDYKVCERTDSIGWDILIRMELLTSLSEYAQKSTMDESEVVKIGTHICKALELCASRNLIHRDIKMDNIFVSRYGEYKLGDFGIARHADKTMAGMTRRGTFTYMAPEVWKGIEYGASVDIYSLGIVMYTLLNKNRGPFLPDYPNPIMPSDRDDALHFRMKGEPLPPLKNVSPELSKIILKACSYDRKERFSSAAEMYKALKVVQGTVVSENIANPQVDYNTFTSTPANDLQETDSYTVSIFEEANIANTFPKTSEMDKVDHTDESENVVTMKDIQYQEPQSEDETKYDIQKSKHLKKKLWISMVALLIILIGVIIFFISNQTKRDISTQNSTKETSKLLTTTTSEPPATTTTASLTTTTTASPITYELGGKKFRDDDISLDFSELGITDISPLKNLKKIKKLELSKNSIEDISVLKELTTLEYLSLWDNSISDISSLKNLTNLTSLYIVDSKITDISALKNLKKIKILYLGYNSITDISTLKQLTNLKSLSLSSNLITDISSLQNLKKIETLSLIGNQINDISTLKQLTNLKSLYLGYNSITDISTLKQLTNLESLGLGNNPINDISVLKNLTKLTDLHLEDTKITDLSPLQNLKNLKYLNLWRTPISDATALYELTKLTKLYIIHTNLTNDQVADLRKALPKCEIVTEWSN